MNCKDNVTNFDSEQCTKIDRLGHYGKFAAYDKVHVC